MRPEENNMSMYMRRALIGLALATLAVLLVWPALAQGPDPIADPKALADALRAGGHVIVVRHGATFSDQADTDPFNLDNVAKQRNLNDKGKALAKAFGDAVRKAGIPIGEVYTSLFNRAYETAVLAGFKAVEKTADLTEGGLVVSPDENNRRAEAFRKKLAKEPGKGTNDLLITHKPNIVDALGKDWFDVKEGEASIFKPGVGKYMLVARLQMDDWAKLAAAR
jgi:phosphohistidine phosphatase SixA